MSERVEAIGAELTALDREAVGERDLKRALASFVPVWDALFPAERARVMQLLIECVVYDGRTGEARSSSGQAGSRCSPRTRGQRHEGQGHAAAAQEGEGCPEPARVSRVARMLALAHHVERLVEDGQISGYAEAARVLGITRSRLGQIVGLLGLSAEIQSGILTREVEVSARAARRVAREVVWERQREMVGA